MFKLNAVIIQFQFQCAWMNTISTSSDLTFHTPNFSFEFSKTKKSFFFVTYNIARFLPICYQKNVSKICYYDCHS